MGKSSASMDCPIPKTFPEAKFSPLQRERRHIARLWKLKNSQLDTTDHLELHSDFLLYLLIYWPHSLPQKLLHTSSLEQPLLQPPPPLGCFLLSSLRMALTASSASSRDPINLSNVELCCDSPCKCYGEAEQLPPTLMGHTPHRDCTQSVPDPALNKATAMCLHSQKPATLCMFKASKLWSEQHRPNHFNFQQETNTWVPNIFLWTLQA